MSDISALIFDLDDTLYSERSYAFSGFDAVAKGYEDRLGSWEKAAQRMQEIFESEHRRKVFNIILQEHDVDDHEKIVSDMIEIYRNHKPDIFLYPDAETLLSRLQGSYKLGLITDGPAVMQANKVDALDLRPRFDAIVLTDKLGAGFSKPHPKAFELMTEQLGVQPQECVYIADNASKDFLAPNQLGWSTFHVERPEGIYKDATSPPEGEAKSKITSLNQLEEKM